MSVDLKKAPSNGCENLLTSDEQQAKVFCLLYVYYYYYYYYYYHFILGHENATVLLEKKLIKDS
jgi:hypothetical protein